MNILKKVDLERALKRSCSDFIIRGEGVEELVCKDKRMMTRLEILKQGGTMSFIRINELIHNCLDELEYIIFWENVDILLVDN